MKKVLSVLTASILAVSIFGGVNSSFAQDSSTGANANPFEKFDDANVITEKEVHDEQTEIALVTSFKTENSKVIYTVSLDNVDAKVKSAKVVLKFPDVLSTTVEQITKGALLENMNDQLTVVDAENNTVTFVGSSLTAVPASGELFSVEFDANPSTVEQEYPFSVDVSASEITDELNNDVVISYSGVDMVKVGTAAMEEEEVKKETGFGSTAALLIVPFIAGLAYFRRKNV